MWQLEQFKFARKHVTLVDCLIYAGAALGLKEQFLDPANPFNFVQDEKAFQNEEDMIWFKNLNSFCALQLLIIAFVHLPFFNFDDFHIHCTEIFEL